MARAGFGQADVDEMELWVIADLLGVNDQPAQPSGVVTAEQFAADAAALNKRRLEAAKRGEKVEPPANVGAEPMAVTDDMRAAMAARRDHRRNHQGAPVPGCTYCEAVT